MGQVIWIVNHYAALPREAGGTRHYWLARGLRELGWDVRLIRSGPEAERRRSPYIEDVEGVEVTTIRGPSVQVRGARRVLGWAEFSALLASRSTTRHLTSPDVVLGSTVHLGAAAAARVLARRHDAAFVFEVRDLWPETLIALGALEPESILAQAMRRLEGSLARSASLIISPLSGVGRYMSAKHGVSPSRFLWLSNGVNYSNYRNVPKPAEGPLRLQYFGSIGRTNDVGLLVESVGQANRLLQQPVSLQIRGTGPGQAALVSHVQADAGLSQAVSFEPPVPSSSVPDAMAWGNAVAVTVRDLPGLYKYGIGMNKLFDYLASGRWIIMASGVLDNPIADAPGLSICRPSSESISTAIAQVARMDPVARDRLASRNAAMAKDTFDYKVLSAQLNDALINACEP